MIDAYARTYTVTYVRIIINKFQILRNFPSKSYKSTKTKSTRSGRWIRLISVWMDFPVLSCIIQEMIKTNVFVRGDVRD